MVCFGFATWLWKTGINIGGPRLRGPAAHVPQLPQGQEHIATAQAIGRAAAFLRPGHLLLVGRGTPPGATQLRHKLGLMIVKLERTHDFGSFLSFLVVDQGEKVWTTQV